MHDLKIRAESILRASNVILEDDHFVYVSGDHGSGWVNKDALLPHTEKTNELASLLAESCRELAPDVICGPAIGGLIIGQWVGFHLRLPTVFAEHATQSAADGAMRAPFALGRGFDRLVCGKRVLIVDDIVNTGHSIRQTAQAVRTAGGEPIAAAAYCSRGNAGAAELSVPEFRYLVEFKIPSWAAASCALCAQGVPVNTEYAHGRDFLLQEKVVNNRRR